MTSYTIPEVRFTQLFINNEYVNSSSGKTFTTINPSDEQVICQVQEADATDVSKAATAAKSAFQLGSEWRTMDASSRGRLLFKLATLIEQNLDYLACLETLDSGKPVTCVMEDMRFVVKTIRYYAGYADKMHGKCIPSDGNTVTFTRREPLGVAACITPWNYPFVMAMYKLAPCLAAGCTMVLKPAELTPLTSIYLGSIIKEAGFPPGVVNILPGSGRTTDATLCQHPDVNTISFTGSTDVGKTIMQYAVTTIKPVTLELGGKSPLIIFADANLDKAAETAHEATMINSGQVRTGATRIFVQAPIYDEMVRRLKTLAEKRKVGNPFHRDTTQGPQIDRTQFDRVMSYIQTGIKEGARLVTGGSRHGQKGFFIQPTVFADVTDEMTISREEIFGPVQTILRFTTLDEVIQRANATQYGLGAGVFTENMDKAMRVAQGVQAGSFWINCYLNVAYQVPLGGYKMSGMGKELGKEGIEAYMQTKTVMMPVTQKNS